MGAVVSIQGEFNLKLEKKVFYNDKCVDFKRHSQFTSVKDFNNEWSIIMTEYKKFFTKPQLTVLTIIRQYAAKNFGVCNASYRTLNLAHTKKYGVGISRELWRTAVNKADELGILNKHDGERLKQGRGSKTANVLIFNRYDYVRAYAITKKDEEEEEIARLLELEYAKSTAVNSHGFKARQWAEEKAMRKAQAEARKQAEKERKEQEQRDAERKAKMEQKKSLYKKMLTYIQYKKMESTIDIKEFSKIAFGSINNILKETNISQEQAEEIAYKLFVQAVEAKPTPKRPTVNHAALFSWLMKDNLKMLKGEKQQMTKTEIANNSGKRIEMIPQSMVDGEGDPVKKAKLKQERIEQIKLEIKQFKTDENAPGWFKEQKLAKLQTMLEVAEKTPITAVKTEPEEDVDFEELRIKLLAKLGKNPDGTRG